MASNLHVLASSAIGRTTQFFAASIVGTGGQGILRTGDSFEYAVANGAASHDSLVPLAQLQAPTVDPARLNSRRVTELMTQAGLL